MRNYLALFLLLITAAANAANYEAGQVWSYHHRPDDDDSTVIIDQVESDPNLGTIYHVSVLQVHVKDSTGSIKLINLPHCPVSSTTLDTSLVALIGWIRGRPITPIRRVAAPGEGLNRVAPWSWAFSADLDGKC